MDPGRMEGLSRSRRTSKAEVFIEPSGIVVVRFDAGCRLDLVAGEELLAAHVELSAGGKHPVLADLRGMISVERRAREAGARETVAAVTRKMALLVRSPVSRVIGSFFLRVSAPKFPTQIFTDEARARSWLLEGHDQERAR